MFGKLLARDFDPRRPVGTGRTGTSSGAVSLIPATARRSHAFEQITSHLSAREGLHIIDFGGAQQTNIDFFCSLGHRLYSEDLLRSIDSFFTAEELEQKHFSETRIVDFVEENLTFPEESADAALCWDVLQFIPASLALAIVERLHRSLAPDSYLLAYFHAEASHAKAPAHVCNIVDPKTLVMRPRGAPRPLQPYNNRSIEKLFHQFRTIKFFLTRDHLREIIIQR